jgi:hypothetical protein
MRFMAIVVNFRPQINSHNGRGQIARIVLADDRLLVLAAAAGIESFGAACSVVGNKSLGCASECRRVC